MANPKKKYFKVSLTLETGRKVEADDINIMSDDVIDGFTLSRTDRLGDLTENFHLDGFSDVEVKEIKNSTSRTKIREAKVTVIQLNWKGISQPPVVTRDPDLIRRTLKYVMREAFGKVAPKIKDGEDINAYMVRYDEWRDEQNNCESDVHLWELGID